MTNECGVFFFAPPTAFTATLSNPAAMEQVFHPAARHVSIWMKFIDNMIYAMLEHTKHEDQYIAVVYTKYIAV